MANEQQGPQIQIELRPEVGQGIYSNMALIAHSPTEFVTDFVSIMPNTPKAQVVSRIIMAPEHAKRLLFALQANIVRYETQFGAIRMPEECPKTVPPFMATPEK